MEHRLCHKTQAGHSMEIGDAMIVPETPEVAAARKLLEQQERGEKEKTLRRILMEDVAEETIQRILDDPDEFARTIRYSQKAFEERLSLSAQLSRDQLKPVIETLSPPTPEKPSGLPTEMYEQVSTMIDALQDDVFEKEAKHRYGSTARLNFEQIRNDRQLLADFKTANVTDDTLAALSQVDARLDFLAHQDGRLEAWEAIQDKRDSPVNKALGGIGKMAGVLVLTIAGLGFGIPAIARLMKDGKVDMKELIAPLLCFGIAIPMASASVRRMALGTLPENFKIDMQCVLGNPKFRQLCRDYEIQGEEWADVVGTMMDQPQKTNAFAAHFRSGGRRLSDEKLTELTNEYIDELGIGGDQEKQLRKMIADNRFSDLPYMLSFVQTKDAKSVITDYVRVGARRYEGKAYAAAAKLNELEENEKNT